jgi:hypothetical protein
LRVTSCEVKNFSVVFLPRFFKVLPRLPATVKHVTRNRFSLFFGGGFRTNGREKGTEKENGEKWRQAKKRPYGKNSPVTFSFFLFSRIFFYFCCCFSLSFRNGHSSLSFVNFCNPRKSLYCNSGDTRVGLSIGFSSLIPGL